MDFSNLTMEREAETAYILIGQAITVWSNVESSLCNVFSACIGGAYTLPGGGFISSGAADVAFYAVENFRAKLTMTDKVFRYQFAKVTDAEDMLKCWQKAHDQARRLSGRRNVLAHWNLICFDKRKPGQRYRLMPAFGTPAYHKESQNTQGGMAIPELFRLNVAFDLLSERINAVSRIVGAHQGLRSRFVSQVASLMHNLSLSDPIALEHVKRDLSWPE